MTDTVARLSAMVGYDADTENRFALNRSCPTHVNAPSTGGRSARNAAIDAGAPVDFGAAMKTSRVAAACGAAGAAGTGSRVGAALHAPPVTPTRIAIARAEKCRRNVGIRKHMVKGQWGSDQENILMAV